MIGALRYWAARMFASRYWPKTGSNVSYAHATARVRRLTRGQATSTLGPTTTSTMGRGTARTLEDA